MKDSINSGLEQINVVANDDEAALMSLEEIAKPND